jgi:hypothetical protein
MFSPSIIDVLRSLSVSVLRFVRLHYPVGILRHTSTMTQSVKLIEATLIVIAIFLTLLTATVHGWITTSVDPTRRLPVTQSRPTPTQLPSILITISPRGFEPGAFSIPQGKFFILVENRSGLHSVNLRLDRMSVSRLYDVHVPREQLDWAELLDLSPGEYVLTEADHPDWACRFTVTP